MPRALGEPTEGVELLRGVKRAGRQKPSSEDILQTGLAFQKVEVVSDWWEPLGVDTLVYTHITEHVRHRQSQRVTPFSRF